MTDTVQTAVEREFHFKVGPIELLLFVILALALLRVGLERRAPRVRVVELEPYAGLDDPTKLKVGPALQRRLNELGLAPPVVLPSPTATESLGSVLAETGVPPATAVGKGLKSIASLVWPKAGYIATWTADIPKPASVAKATATVAVREASSGVVIGSDAVSADDIEGAVDLAAGAIWSIVMKHDPIGATIPIWKRWIVPGGSTYVTFRQVTDDRAQSASTADTILELRRLRKLEPFNADIPFALAEAYTADDDHLKAIHALRHAIQIADVAIKPRYRLAAAYSFAALWLKEDREAEIRRLEKEVLPRTEAPRLWDELQGAFLAEAEREYEALLADLGWFRVLWKTIRVDRAAASDLRPFRGLWRGTDRGRSVRLIRSALYVTQLQRRRLCPPTESDASWLRGKVRSIENASRFAHDWKVEYNLVCLLAQAVERGISRDEADRRVVARLTRMLTSSRSPADAALLKWMACDDPDLDGLRFEGSRFRRFWAGREFECLPAAPAENEGTLTDRFEVAAGWARLLAAFWGERAAIVVGWTQPVGDLLVGWFDHEQRVGTLMVDWIHDPTDERAAALIAVVGFLPGEPPEGGHVELVAGWGALAEPANVARDATRKTYETLVTERASGKVGLAHTAAIASTMRAGRRWRLLAEWLIKPADADAKKAYIAALELESQPPPAAEANDAEEAAET